MPGLAVAGKWALSRLERSIGKRTDSDALVAAGTAAKMDVLASLLTLVAVIVSRLTGWGIDGYVGVALREEISRIVTALPGAVSLPPFAGRPRWRSGSGTPVPPCG